MKKQRIEAPFDYHCPWEWMASLTLPTGCNPAVAQVLLKRWRLALAKRSGLILGMETLLITNHSPHLHVMMVGRNSNGKTLLDCNPRSGKDEWEMLVNRNADVELIYSPEIRNYLESKRNMSFIPACYKGRSSLRQAYEQLPPYWPEQLKRMPGLSDAIRHEFTRATDNILYR